ncbi:MAG TPA: iron-uptake factor, partial [Xanthomonadaceae bacterium]|nr:iron-uptake factor [Xanthomonadaceae bacterium]
AAPGLRRGYLDLRLPGRPGQPATARVKLGEAAHDRAYDSLQLDPATGAVIESLPYAGLPTGRRITTSMFALHSGSFFGLPGRVVVMLSSLAMSVFFVTGWMLYLDRRRKKRQARASRLALAMADGGDAGDGHWLVSFASQSGFAEQLAWRTAGQLQAAGLPVQVHPLARLDGSLLAGTRRALFVISTFGDGEAPDAARAFERKVLGQNHPLRDLGYAVLALGDRQYASFCGFPRRVDAWLGAQGARSLFPPVEVDGSDAAALQRWQAHLVELTGAPAESPLLAGEAPFLPWTLDARLHLNRGSAGGAIWRVALTPPADVAWQAGDILQILPRHAPQHVHAVLARLGLDPGTTVTVAGTPLALALAVAERVLPEPPAEPMPPADVQAWLSSLPMLPQREYSIASIQVDGRVELVVRLAALPDGRTGLGSGWLTTHAEPGQPIQARVRRNPAFHRRAGGAPMILIGNGTGIAGLRSLLREAAGDAHRGHWLIYGERQRAHDHVFADEIEDWQRSGHLVRVDLAFSRDQAGRVYVQDLLRAALDGLRRWVDEGATIHVCGSMQGMAQAVDEVLCEALGVEQVDALRQQGRYRRDVY